MKVKDSVPQQTAYPQNQMFAKCIRDFHAQTSKLWTCQLLLLMSHFGTPKRVIKRAHDCLSQWGNLKMYFQGHLKLLENGNFYLKIHRIP